MENLTTEVQDLAALSRLFLHHPVFGAFQPKIVPAPDRRPLTKLPIQLPVLTPLDFNHRHSFPKSLNFQLLSLHFQYYVYAPSLFQMFLSRSTTCLPVFFPSCHPCSQTIVPCLCALLPHALFHPFFLGPVFILSGLFMCPLCFFYPLVLHLISHVVGEGERNREGAAYAFLRRLVVVLTAHLSLS